MLQVKYDSSLGVCRFSETKSNDYHEIKGYMPVGAYYNWPLRTKVQLPYTYYRHLHKSVDFPSDRAFRELRVSSLNLYVIV